MQFGGGGAVIASLAVPSLAALILAALTLAAIFYLLHIAIQRLFNAGASAAQMPILQRHWRWGRLGCGSDWGIGNSVRHGGSG